MHKKKAPSIKPWWTQNLDKPNEKELLKNLNSAFDDLQDYSSDFKDICLQHIALYQGLSMGKDNGSSRRMQRDTEGSSGSTKMNQLIVNHLRDITDAAVSRLATTKPSTAVLPNHGVEFQDKAKAKVVKSWLDSFNYANNVDDIRRVVQRNAFICGEAYLRIDWDETKGDIHPGAKKLKKDIKVELEDGETITVSKLKRVGDVGLTSVLPFKVFSEPHPSNDFNKVSWVMTEELEYIEQLKADFPEEAKKIKPTKTNAEGDNLFLTEDDDKHDDQVTVVTLFHKATPEVPEGRQIKFTRDVILENIELPYSHGELPLIRLSSIDLPGHMRGMSPFHDLKVLQSAINTLYTIMLRDRSLAAPKLFVPSGSVDPNQQATNQPGVVQYKGGVPPTWSVPNMISGDIMSMIEKLEHTFEKLSNSSGTRRGDGIPNVEAFKAFGFFEEQATQRESTSIAKHKDFLQSIYLMITLTAADFYTQSDERMIKMMGRHNQYLLKHFNVDDLKHSYDIRVENTSALPESKAARTQTIIQLAQAFPNVFTDEKVSDMLNFSSPDAFFDLATAAINAAEAENEEIMAGNDVAEPQPFEDLLQHWESHVKQFNNPSLKSTLPRDGAETNQLIQEVLSGENTEELTSPALLLVKHLNTTEGLMFQRALINPKFAGRLADFENYPVFFQPPMTISEILQSHAAPLEPIAGDMGVDQEVVLPITQELNNPNSFSG